jgi:hypothetical protein
MRNMSFMLTQEQIKNRTKIVTRRLGWRNIRVDQQIRAVDRVRGLKKGEHPRELAIIRVTGERWEPLKVITREEVIKEGFPELSKVEFIRLFCKSMRCTPDTLVHRIEFEYVD